MTIVSDNAITSNCHCDACHHVGLPRYQAHDLSCRELAAKHTACDYSLFITALTCLSSAASRSHSGKLSMASAQIGNSHLEISYAELHLCLLLPCFFPLLLVLVLLLLAC